MKSISLKNKNKKTIKKTQFVMLMRKCKDLCLDEDLNLQLALPPIADTVDSFQPVICLVARTTVRATGELFYKYYIMNTEYYQVLSSKSIKSSIFQTYTEEETDSIWCVSFCLALCMLFC